MDIDLADLPDNVETLQRMVRTLATERANLTEAQAEIERLRLIVQKLQRSQFGRRAERSRKNLDLRKPALFHSQTFTPARSSPRWIANIRATSSTCATSSPTRASPMTYVRPLSSTS
jgi:hypothetical protein